MKKILFLRLSPDLGSIQSPPKDIIIPSDIAQTISLFPKDKYHFSVIDTWVEDLTIEQIVKRIAVESPSILAITTEGLTAQITMRIFKKVKKKKRSFYNIVFGPYASFFPETFLFQNSPVNVCVLGEAEKTMVDFINNPSSFKKIPGVAYWDKKTRKIIKTKPKKLITNLDSLPFLAHEYFLKKNQYKTLFPTGHSFKNVKWGFLISSRGCPYNCNFCSPLSRNSWGEKFRAKSPHLVVDEVEYLIRNFGVNAIDFEDDLFTFNQERAEKICDEIIQRKIRISFVIQTRIDKLNQKLIKKLKKAGCSSITLGIESGNEKILSSTGKKINKIQIKKMCNQIKKMGINMRLNFIIGHPGETLKQARETLEFAKELNSLYFHCHYYSPFPGSQIYRSVAKTYPSFKNLSPLTCVINLSEIPNGIYKNLLKNFYKSYYLSPHYLFKHLPFHFKNLILHPREYFVYSKNIVKFLSPKKIFM